MPGVKKKNTRRRLPDGTRTLWLKTGNKRVRYHECGTGPAVLFVHGWASNGAQLSSMITEVRAAGFKTVWFDLPAHGASSGWQTSIFEVRECIKQLANECGTFDTVVGHSFGALSLMFAISDGFSAGKLVAISSPSGVSELAEKFCKMFGARDKSREYLITLMERKFGMKVQQKLSTQSMAENIRQPVLLIHDKHDPLVNCKGTIAISQKLVNAELLLTEQLGHNRIVHDPGVISTVLEFITTADCSEFPGMSSIKAG